MPPIAFGSIVLLLGERTSEHANSLAAAGFTTREELLPGDACELEHQAVGCEGVAVVVLSAPLHDLTRNFLGKLRADTADTPVGVLWLPHSATDIPAALEAGADVAIATPIEPDLLLAQVRALVRSWEHTIRLGGRGVDARLAHDRLRKAFEQADLQAQFAGRILRSFAPENRRISGSSPLRLAHSSGETSGIGTWGHDLWLEADGTVGVLLFDLAGLGPVTGALVASVIHVETIRWRAEPDGQTIPRSPAEMLHKLNQSLFRLPLPEQVVVSATVAMIAPSGLVRVACAGSPPPVQVPTQGPAEVWVGSGPFLGIADTTFAELSRELGEGERLIFIYGTEAADRRPDVRAASTDILDQELQAYADALAISTLAKHRAALLIVERS